MPRVEVAYALPDQQVVVELEVAPETTLRQAIAESGLSDRFPEINLERCKAGVFGRPCGLNERVKDGDRVEIYRDLPVDPKEIRRRRAAR